MRGDLCMTENEIKEKVKTIKDYIRLKSNNYLDVSDNKIEAYINLCYPDYDSINPYDVFLSELCYSIKAGKWNFFDEKSKKFSITTTDDFSKSDTIKKLISEDKKILLFAASCDGIPVSFCEASPFFNSSDKDSKVKNADILIELLKRNNLSSAKALEYIKLGCDTPLFIEKVNINLAYQYNRLYDNKPMKFSSFPQSTIRQFVCYDIINKNIYNEQQTVFNYAFSLINDLDAEVTGTGITIKDSIAKQSINETVLSFLCQNPNINLNDKMKFFKQGIEISSIFNYNKEIFKEFYFSQIENMFKSFEDWGSFRNFKRKSVTETTDLLNTYGLTLNTLAQIIAKGSLPESCMCDFVNRYLTIDRDFQALKEIIFTIASVTKDFSTQCLLLKEFDKDPCCKDVIRKKLYFNKNVSDIANGESIKSIIGNKLLKDCYSDFSCCENYFLADVLRNIPPKSELFESLNVSEKEFYKHFLESDIDILKISVVTSHVIPDNILKELISEYNNKENEDIIKTLGEITLAIRKMLIFPCYQTKISFLMLML